MLNLLLFLNFSFPFIPDVWAHETHRVSIPVAKGLIAKVQEPATSQHQSVFEGEEELDPQLKLIAQHYTAKVAPILKRACADCHSSDTEYPWYFAVPLVRSKIIKDIEEAREHLDISSGYPFVSHASPLEDLQAIEKVLINKQMPPLSYRLLHRKASITKDERDLILSWSRRGQELMRQVPDKAPKISRDP